MSTQTLPAEKIQNKDQQFVKGIGLMSATTLVMGSMIGSGIFIVSAGIARDTNSPALLLGAWIVTGLLTIVGALAFGELAAMMPQAGGQYIYLREAFGPLWGFLYGWTLFTVIQTGTIAAVGVAFGKFMGIFFPIISADQWLWHPIIHIPGTSITFASVGLNTQNLMGIGVVVVLTFINIFGVKTGAFVQNVFTIAKVGALAMLVVVGMAVGRNAEAVAANFTNFWHWDSLHKVSVGAAGTTAFVGTLTVLAIAQVGSLFSADAWHNVTFTAAEVKNPKRNLPLSLILGTGTVIALYVLANVVYLNVLPLEVIKTAPADRVGTLVMQTMFGDGGARLMAIAILLSTFGCCNGLILTGARVFYAMANDGLFFKPAGNLHHRYKTPVVSLLMAGAWTCLLTLSGTYNQLLDYIVFAVLIFYILAIASVFVLRWKLPDAERPYKALGYPVLPALYILIALFIDVVLLLYKPQYTWPGLIIVLLGIPVYYFWTRVVRRNTAA